MQTAPILDERTAGAIRAAIAAASRGAMSEACSIGETALSSGGDVAALNAMLGMLRCQSGEIEAGIRHLRAAHQARPSDLKIMANLASALANAGRHPEVLELLTLEQARSDASLNLQRLRGFSAQVAEDFPAAVTSYEQIVSAAPEDWEAWNNLGNARRCLGDFEGSVTALRRAVKLNPHSLPVRVNLALAVGATGGLKDAETQLRALAAEFPNEPAPLRELHSLLKEQAREEDALEVIEKAIKLDPSNLATVLALAGQRLLLHDYVGAETAYRKAVDLSPSSATANLGLALFFELNNRTDELGALVDEARERGVEDGALRFIKAFHLRREKRFAEGLEELRLVPDTLESVRRLHLMGQLLEGAGRYDEAFEAFSRMNQLALENPSVPERRAAAYRKLIRGQPAVVTPEWVESWQPFEPDDGQASPVFLVGFPRSGTTLLDTMLMGHPHIEVLEEEPTLREASLVLKDAAALPTMDRSEIQAARDAYFRTAATLTPLREGSLLVDKNPLAMNQLPFIRRIFPDARVILAVRHPCDAVLSCFVTNFRSNDGMASFLRLESAAELYDLSFSYLEHVQKLMPMPMHRVVYEKVVADRASELQALFGFLDLDWHDAVLDHEATALGRGRIKTASYAQVVEPIYTRSAGRWEKYRKHLEPVLPVLRPWIDHFGYQA